MAAGHILGASNNGPEAEAFCSLPTADDANRSRLRQSYVDLIRMTGQDFTSFVVDYSDGSPRCPRVQLSTPPLRSDSLAEIVEEGAESSSGCGSDTSAWPRSTSPPSTRHGTDGHRVAAGTVDTGVPVFWPGPAVGGQIRTASGRSEAEPARAVRVGGAHPVGRHRAQRGDPVFRELTEFHSWLAQRRAANIYAVHVVGLDQLDGWHFDISSGNLVHRTGRFFSIEGIEISTDHREIPTWMQPIIMQPEVGILVKEFDGVPHCLMQAKMEPGNINFPSAGSPSTSCTR